MKYKTFKSFLTNILFVCACANGFSVVASETADATTQVEKQLSLKIADINYSVLFENTVTVEISNEFFEKVVADVQLIYDRFPANTMRGYNAEKKFIVKDKEIISKKRITPYFWPEQFTNNHLYVADFKEKDHIVITKGLQNAYLNAILSKKNHPLEFKKLYEFIDYFNNIGDYIEPKNLLKLYDCRFAPYMETTLIAETEALNKKSPKKKIH